jgi:hydroxyacyl-ACP dehydratase HTD2-like protein with hotdog domain
MSAPNLALLRPGAALPERLRATDIVQSFFYNAALWNAHRIHYELDYATKAEGYAGLVVPGPLLGDWLGQCAEEWAGDAGRVVALSYSNRLATLVGESVVVGGTVKAVDLAAREAELELWVKNAGGEVVTPGSARVRFAR